MLFENLKGSNDYFKILMSIIPGHVYWLNRKGEYLGCNNLQAKMFGLNAVSEVVGKTNLQIFEKTDPDLAMRLNAANEKVMSQEIPVSLEEISISPSGERITHLSNKIPLKDKNGDVIGMLGVSIDITEQKNALKKVQAALAEKEKADKANQLKTKFLSNMSHEIRSPLNTIYGYAQLLKKDMIPSEEEKKESYQTIQDGCTTLLQLIDDIIDVSKIESDQLKITTTFIDLTKLLQELYKEFKDKKEEVTLTLENPSGTQPFFIQTDPLRLKQILTNLISNAFKATETGVVTFGYTQENETLHFHVKDTGKGIKDEDKCRLFKRFEKLDNTEGTGIGLTIVQKLVQLLGGDISFESTEGKGSSFCFSTPLVRGTGAATENYQRVNHITDTNFTGKILLVIEDLTANFEMIDRFTKDTGITLLWAQNGKTALEIFNASPRIDAVLVDIGLPDMSGVEVLKHIRNTERGRETPAIAHTAYVMDEEIQAYKEAGFKEVIPKPAKYEELLGALCKWLR